MKLNLDFLKPCNGKLCSQEQRLVTITAATTSALYWLLWHIYQEHKLILWAVIKYYMYSTNDGWSKFWWQRKRNVLPKQLCCCHLLEPCSQVLIKPCRKSSCIIAGTVAFPVALVIFSCVLGDLEVSCLTNFILCYKSHKSLIRYHLSQLLDTFLFLKLLAWMTYFWPSYVDIQIQDHMKEILIVLLIVDITTFCWDDFAN